MRVIGGHSNSDDDEMNPTAGKLRRVVCMTGGEKEGSRIGIGVPECSSPARVAFLRLLAIVRKCRGGKGVARDEIEIHHTRKVRIEKFDPTVEEVRRDSPEILPEYRPTNEVSEMISQGIHHSECQRQEMTFNLAAGLGLLSLIAASKTELDKTIELRREMELFLRGIKQEHDQSNNTTTPNLSDPRLGYAVSTTLDGLSNDSIGYSFEDHAPLHNQPDEHCNMHQKEVSIGGMNHLEEELAAELERLEVDVETEELSENQEEVNTEVNASRSMSSGEVVDPQDHDGVIDGGNNTEYCGVPPLELERRLHEVLEARQDERIKELEAHIECMKLKLQEKEVEVTWWKDTAKLISKQVPDNPSRYLR